MVFKDEGLDAHDQRLLVKAVLELLQVMILQEHRWRQLRATNHNDDRDMKIANGMELAMDLLDGIKDG